MRGTLLKVFVLAAVLSAVGGAAVSGVARPAADSVKDGKTLEEIAGYKKWTRVTAMPVPIEFSWVGG
jgi:hypothetical protein